MSLTKSARAGAAPLEFDLRLWDRALITDLTDLVVNARECRDVPLAVPLKLFERANRVATAYQMGLESLIRIALQREVNRLDERLDSVRWQDELLSGRASQHD